MVVRIRLNMPRYALLSIMSVVKVENKNPNEDEKMNINSITKAIVVACMIVGLMNTRASTPSTNSAGMESTISESAMPIMYVSWLVGELTTMSWILKSFLKCETSIWSEVPAPIMAVRRPPSIATPTRLPLLTKNITMIMDIGARSELTSVTGEFFSAYSELTSI